RVDDTCCLRGYQGLMVDDRQEGRLYQLRFDQGTPDAKERLIRERDRPLDHRVHLSAEMKSREILPEALARSMEDRQGAQIGQRVGVEPQTDEVLDRLFQTGKEQVSAVGREAADEQLESRGVV